MKNILTIAILAVAFTGCTVSGETEEIENLYTIEFSSVIASPGGGLIPDLSAENRHGKLHIQGAIILVSPCHQMQADVSLEDDIITFTVTPKPLEVICLGVAATFGYHALVKGIPPGTYLVRINHFVTGTNIVKEKPVALK